MPHSAERKRLQRGGGTGKGLEDCRKASIGVWGSAELRGRDTHSWNQSHHLSTSDVSTILHMKTLNTL